MARDIEVPPAQIIWKNRKPMGSFQMGCGFLGLVMVLLQVVIAIYIIAGTNGVFDPRAAVMGNCPAGLLPSQYFCVDEELAARYVALQSSGECNNNMAYGGMWPRRLEKSGNEELLEQNNEFLDSHDYRRLTRRLQSEDDDSMWDRFGQNAQIPGVLVPCVFIMGVLWIFILRKFAKACIYGTIFLAVAFFAFMSIFPTLLEVAVCVTGFGEAAVVSNDALGMQYCMDTRHGTFMVRSGSFEWVFLIPAGVMIVLTFINRKKIDVAALCLSKCCLSLQERPSIVLAALGVFAGFAFYLGMWIGFMLNFFSHLEVKCSEFGAGAEITVKDNDTIMQIMGILVLPTYIYFEMMVVVVVACGVGGWYFQDGTDIPGNPACEGLKWAYTSSSGAVFLSTIITWPIIEIRNYIYGKWAKFAMCPMLPCSWLYYILIIIWCCFLRPYLAFTRFMLIAHTFHGGDVFATAKNAWAILKKHLGGAVVTDTIAALVLNTGVWILSIGFAFISWVWMERAMGTGILEDMFGGTADNATATMCIVLGLVGCLSYFCKHSLLTIILLAFAAKYLVGNTFRPYHPFMCGLFVGAICNIIFCFLGKIVQAGMDTIFFCFALEAEHALLQSRPGMTDIHEMIKNNIVTPLPSYVTKNDNSTPVALNPKESE